MLVELHIRNFAIIDELDFELQKGFNVFTGETGAGKSIIVDALEIAVGGRADAEMIRADCEDAEVEARFDLSDAMDARKKVAEKGFPGERQFVLKRIISKSGKNRAYINGSISTTTMLREIGEKILDIHGQHQHQSLLRLETHIDFLDRFGGLVDKRSAFALLWDKWKSVRDELKQLREQEKQKEAKEEFLKFQLREIEEAKLRAGEEESLREERKILNNSEKLMSLAQEIYSDIYSKDGSVLGVLSSFRKRVSDLAEVDTSFSQQVSILDNCIIQLQESAQFFKDYAGKITYSPSRLDEIESRLALISRLKKKYGDSIENILEKSKEFKTELEKMEHAEERIRILEAEDAELSEKLNKEASVLTGMRLKAAQEFKIKIEKELRTLGLEKARFEVSLNDVELSALGKDCVEFMLSPNIGEGLRSLARIVSGGELSRIMLAFKRVLAGFSGVPVLVFDEVDAGIGGAVADVVGRKLKDVSRSSQVLCVTHLPQIACYADHHFVVWKTEEKNRTVTRVKLLEHKDRVEELARMVSGMALTQKSLEYARELLQKAG